MSHRVNNLLFYIRKLVVISLAWIAGFTSPYIVASELPALGQDAATIISPYEERRIGEEAMVQIRQSLDFVSDAELSYYLQQIGARLAASLPNSPHDFQFFLIAHPEINAFALPGGFVGVHTGLITASRSESELAAVLAHEISHVTQRHWPRMVAAEKDRAGMTLAAVLASIIIAGSGNPNGAGVAMAAMAANADSQLAYTRSFEREADRIGIRLLSDGGYDVSAMAGFFERLAEGSRYAGVEVPEFMRTHPVTNDRIAEARDNEKRFTRHPSRQSEAFLHLVARIKALYQPDTANSITGFRSELSSETGSKLSKQAARYGLALALMSNGDFGQAKKEISILTGERPDFLQYQVAAADIELGSGRTDDGLRLYRYIYKSHARNTWVLQRYAEVLIANQRAATALNVLKLALQQHPQDPILNKLMATASGDTGDLIQAHRSMAEYYVLNGDRHAAINQLNIAERNAGKNYYVQAAIKARRLEIESGLGPTTQTK